MAQSTDGNVSTARGHAPIIGAEVMNRFRELFKDCFYDPERLLYVGPLGNGTYAEVFQCTLDGRPVAVKKMRYDSFPQEQESLDFFRETLYLKVSKLAPHPNILSFVGVTIGSIQEGTQESMCIIEEYMNDGNLHSLIERAQQNKDEITEKERLSIVLQIARALACLHGPHATVIHRDIKPANVLINRDETTNELTVKLADFGLSTLLFDRSSNSRSTESQLHGRNGGAQVHAQPRNVVRTHSSLAEFTRMFIWRTKLSRLQRVGSAALSMNGPNPLTLHYYNLTGQAGSMAYMAPEVYVSDRYNEKADVFSFAIVAYETLCLTHPYTHYWIFNKEYNNVDKDPISQSKRDKDALDRYSAAVQRDGFRAPLAKKWPRELSTLISACWDDDPEKRPTMDYVASRLEEIYKNLPGDNVFIIPAWKQLCSCMSVV